MGTGVMIGAGIFALTGLVAELAGSWFSLAFLAAAVVTAFSAYTYVKLSSAYPSAGGIAMFLSIWQIDNDWRVRSANVLFDGHQ